MSKIVRRYEKIIAILIEDCHIAEPYLYNECTKSANPRCLHGHCWTACISEPQQAAAVSGYNS